MFSEKSAVHKCRVGMLLEKSFGTEIFFTLLEIFFTLLEILVPVLKNRPGTENFFHNFFLNLTNLAFV